MESTMQDRTHDRQPDWGPIAAIIAAIIQTAGSVIRAWIERGGHLF
jgi:hypothetical protein